MVIAALVEQDARPPEVAGAQRHGLAEVGVVAATVDQHADAPGPGAAGHDPPDEQVGGAQPVEALLRRLHLAVGVVAGHVDEQGLGDHALPGLQVVGRVDAAPGACHRVAPDVDEVAAGVVQVCVVAPGVDAHYVVLDHRVVGADRVDAQDGPQVEVGALGRGAPEEVLHLQPAGLHPCGAGPQRRRLGYGPGVGSPEEQLAGRGRKPGQQLVGDRLAGLELAEQQCQPTGQPRRQVGGPDRRRRLQVDPDVGGHG